MEGGLSTRKANPFNPIMIRMKGTQNLFHWNGSILLRLKNKGVVMAERAAEVAVGKKENGADLPWPIHKGSLQKSLDLGHHR